MKIRVQQIISRHQLVNMDSNYVNEILPRQIIREMYNKIFKEIINRNLIKFSVEDDINGYLCNMELNFNQNDITIPQHMKPIPYYSKFYTGGIIPSTLGSP